MILPIIAIYIQIGTQPWCTLNKMEKRIECNYESQDVCEGYRQSNEICIKNKDYKFKKENTNENLSRHN